jgi:signal recognition particle receptor subunit beta
MFYKECQGIVFVIDATDIKRLKLIKEEIGKIDKNLEYKLPISFLANKQDIEGSMKKAELKEYLDIDRLDSNFIWNMKYL